MTKEEIYNNSLFAKYYDYLISENEKYNLTAITQKDDVYIKHFIDSISLNKAYDLNKEVSLCDVGSGAGFPGVPLKICYPNINVTLIEATSKRVNFLRNLTNLLNIDVNLINSRAEDCANFYREKFDVVVARAVANMPILLELLVAFVKINGYIVLYKGDKGIQELKESANALKILGCKCEDVVEYELPNNCGKRTLLKIKKISETNKRYPRRYAEINKKPL